MVFSVKSYGYIQSNSVHPGRELYAAVEMAERFPKLVSNLLRQVIPIA
jgi:phage anti-repressor protein